MNTTSDSKKNCIFVGGVPPTVTPDAVKAYFSQFGPVSKIKMNKSRGNQREKTSHPVLHRGCGFIEMATQEGLSKLLQVREHFLMDQKLDCRLAMTNRERKSYHQTLNQERRKIFIGKLPKTVTKEDIESFFSPMVNIEDITLIQKESKDFAICFLLLKEKYAGEKLAGKSFEIAPSVIVECQMALFPQQLHQRKLAENNSSEPDNYCSVQPSGEEDEDGMPTHEVLGEDNTEKLYLEESKFSDSRSNGQNTKIGDQSIDCHSHQHASRQAVQGPKIVSSQKTIRLDTFASKLQPNSNSKQPGKLTSSLVHYLSSSTQGTSQDFGEFECQGRQWVGQIGTTDIHAVYQNATASVIPARHWPRELSKDEFQALPILPNEKGRHFCSSAHCCRPFSPFADGSEARARHSSRTSNLPSTQRWSLYRRLKLLKLGKPTQRPGFPSFYSPFCF